MSIAWKCPKCGVVLQKRHSWPEHAIRCGSTIAGSVTCGNCGAQCPTQDVYSGKYDVSESMLPRKAIPEDSNTEVPELLLVLVDREPPDGTALHLQKLLPELPSHERGRSQVVQVTQDFNDNFFISHLALLQSRKLGFEADLDKLTWRTYSTADGVNGVFVKIYKFAKENAKSDAEPETSAKAEKPKLAQKPEKEKQTGIYEILMDAVCCIMCADRKMTTRERKAIHTILERTKAPWNEEQINNRINDFIQRVNNEGLNNVIQQTCDKLPEFKKKSKEHILLRCIDYMARADGIVDENEKQLITKFKSAVGIGSIDSTDSSIQGGTPKSVGVMENEEKREIQSNSRPSNTIEQIAATRLDKARCEIAAIVQEDGRVANPIGQKILLGELETLRKNLTLAVESLQNSTDAKRAGIISYDVGVGLQRLCDATLNDPKWALQAAVGTDRCRTRVAKVLRTVEEIAEQLKRDICSDAGGTPGSDTGDKEKKQITVSSGPSLLDYLDTAKGTDELYEMLRTHSTLQIEKLCQTFPIETLRLDLNSIIRDFRNNKRFELILVLAQILLKYEKILEKNPELQLPKSLPAKALSEILMSRLMPFISSQENVDIAHGLRTELYDFAMDLIRVGRNSDALTCLLVSRPSIKKDHDYWICACRFNITQDTKNPNDITTAIGEIEQFMSKKGEIPQEAVRMLEKMLSTLRQRLKE